MNTLRHKLAVAGAAARAPGLDLVAQHIDRLEQLVLKVFQEDRGAVRSIALAIAKEHGVELGDLLRAPPAAQEPPVAPGPAAAPSSPPAPAGK